MNAFSRVGRLISIDGGEQTSNDGLDAVDLMVDPQFIYTDLDGNLVCSCCGVLGKHNGAE